MFVFLSSMFFLCIEPFRQNREWNFAPHVGRYQDQIPPSLYSDNNTNNNNNPNTASHHQQQAFSNNYSNSIPTTDYSHQHSQAHNPSTASISGPSTYSSSLSSSSSSPFLSTRPSFSQSTSTLNPVPADAVKLELLRIVKSDVERQIILDVTFAKFFFCFLLSFSYRVLLGHVSVLSIHGIYHALRSIRRNENRKAERRGFAGLHDDTQILTKLNDVIFINHK